jgi:hypothetical protein
MAILSRPALALGLIFILVAAGCAAMQLDTFRKRAARGDHDWIAAQTVACTEDSDECGQLHLIKGDACFRLARAGKAPADNFACAAHELDRGLSLIRHWNDPADRRQFQESLCESLANILDLQSGDTAALTQGRFEDAAKALFQLAPESVPAVYYLAKARLRQVQSTLAGLNPASRVPACNRLKRSLNGVLSMMEKAGNAPPPDWERFADRYQRLSFDLGVTISAAGCR